MNILICAYCYTEVEIKYLDDIVECPNCNREVSKENCGGTRCIE